MNCLINKPDDYPSIILTFTKIKNQLIFNSYKNITKSGVQKQDIVNATAIKSMRHYLKQHPINNYLFENADGTPLTSAQMETKRS